MGQFVWVPLARYKEVLQTGYAYNLKVRSNNFLPDTQPLNRT